MRNKGLFALMIGAAMLVLWGTGRSSGQENQPECTITVEPGQSLQEVIDQAPEGAVICLPEGVLLTNVIITQSLTLQGRGRARTTLRSREPDRPVLLIRSGENSITVTLDGLRITGARSTIPNYYCIQDYESGKGCAISVVIQGDAHVSIRDAQIDTNDLRGIDVTSGSVSLQDVSISSNGWEGIAFFSSGSLTLQRVEITDNYAGVFLTYGSAHFANVRMHNNRLGSLVTERAQLTLEDAQVSGGQRGLTVAGTAHVRAVRTQFLSNIRGLVVLEAAHVTLEGTTLENNTEVGLEARGSSTVTLAQSAVAANGIGSDCVSLQMLCPGILVQGESQLTVRDSVIRANADWGIAAALKRCGYSDDDFSEHVIFLGETRLEGNNVTGNQNGMGNPGDHPFAHLPDGQVCLP